MNTFAQRLKYAMEQADLKQSALSDRAGIFSNQLGLQVIHHHVVIKGRLNNIHQFLPIEEGPQVFRFLLI